MKHHRINMLPALGVLAASASVAAAHPGHGEDAATLMVPRFFAQAPRFAPPILTQDVGTPVVNAPPGGVTPTNAVARGAALKTEPKRTNVLILLADDLGWNGVGFHSPTAPTPNLSQLAKDGLELQRFYTYPVCSPARAALLTGQMPRRFGIVDPLGPRESGLPKGVATMAHAFRAAGYQTSLIGKWHLGDDNPPQQCGFDHFYGFLSSEIDYFKHTDKMGRRVDWQRDGQTLNEEGYSTYLMADEAVRQLKTRDKEHPFFMEVAFNAPHVPLSAPDDLIAKHQNDGGVYAAVIEGMDIGIGRILTALDEQGLRENTLVLFYSDNGATRRLSDNAPLSYGKDTVYEGGIRTPCVVRWPGQIAAGAQSQQPVSGQDWFPTLAAAVGVPLPENAKLDGSNQWSALHEGKLIERAPILIGSHDNALIDGDWKLVEWYGGQRSLFHLSADISETKDEIATQPEMAKRLGAELDALAKDLPAALPRRLAGPPAGPGAGRPAGGQGNFLPRFPVNN